VGLWIEVLRQATLGAYLAKPTSLELTNFACFVIAVRWSRARTLATSFSHVGTARERFTASTSDFLVSNRCHCGGTFVDTCAVEQIRFPFALGALVSFGCSDTRVAFSLRTFAVPFKHVPLCCNFQALANVG
jgi:hypothetical protein